jgi:two-component system cell cycle sensor histidine kinase/response regulator CckA
VNAVSTLARMIGRDNGLSGRVFPLFLIGAALGITGFGLGDAVQSMAATMAGLTLLMLATGLGGILWLAGWRDRKFASGLAKIAERDASPCFSTNRDGEIVYQNNAARRRFGVHGTVALHAVLSDHFADPIGVLHRLQWRAEKDSSANENVFTRHGQTRLSVHRSVKARFIWRLDTFLDQSDATNSLGFEGLPMLISDAGGRIVHSNDSMIAMLGKQPSHLSALFSTIGQHSGDEIQVQTAKGHTRCIFAETATRNNQREIYLFPISRPETETVRSDDLDRLPVAMIRFDPAGYVHHANRSALNLLNMHLSRQTGVTDLFEGLGRSAADWLTDVASERLPEGSEVLRLRHADQDRFCQVTLKRTVEQGRIWILAILNDATALKTLEAQFIQSQKMQAIGQLAGGIAHDFNNLLTAISGHCDLLLLHHGTDHPDYSDLVQIRQNSNRAAALVGQLLAFSRKQTLKPERLDVQDVLSDLTHLLNRLVGERVSLRLAHAPNLGQIRADKRQLEQVVMNLVVNARDAMESGGTIHIETEAVFLDNDLLRDRAAVPAGSYAVIRVLDSGCGISPDRIEKVFEPFYTTKRPGEGTGLGLSMAYGIVKQSGGFIFCDSQLGQGTVFQLYFPIHAGGDDELVTPPVPSRPVARRGAGVVLLVEDEAPVRAFASRALRLRGYTVLEAENAEDALKTLSDQQLEVDVFVTDVVMPGMDGPSWVRIALQDRPNVRVVFMSGYSEDSLAEVQASIPNSVFLPKPFSLSELTETVHGQMH